MFRRKDHSSHSTNGTPQPTADSGTDYDELQRTVSELNSSRHESSRASDVVAQAGNLDAVATTLIAQVPLSNPTVENAIQVLEQLADLGKVVPFVAPAFAILKIIISVEKQAREADAKCNDLLERITFMLGLLPALKDIQVSESTRLVVERMNSVLKTSASLVQAYRKQGAVARRLNMKSRDKFTSCAATITACSNDLMMSLQIHQTGLLDILSRSVPVDHEDAKAQSFIDSHGGEEAIRADPTLVTQFASTMKLTMDDTVMEQLNTNITTLMQQNQEQIEKLVVENVSAAVVDGMKELAAIQTEHEREQVFRCVQCEKDFRMSTNGPASCNYHKAEYDTWVKKYPCCGQTAPCEVNTHRSVHHCDYPYGPFFPRARAILNYIDTVDTWVEVQDTSLDESGKVQKASIGRLLRWVSKGDRLDEPIILITAGAVWHTQKYFFDTYTVKEIELTTQIISVTKNTTIFRSSPDDTEYTLLEWILSREGTITGVRVTAKAATSETPFVRICPIDSATCTKSGDVVSISDGGFRSFKPATAYKLPDPVRFSPELPKTPIRDPRTDFKTRTSPELPLVLKALSQPALTANPDFANYDYDTFVGSISVFNKHRAGSQNPITISTVSASYRLVGDADYKPVKLYKVTGNQQLPVTIDPRESWPMNFEVQVPRIEADRKLQVRWWNRAFLARERPLRLKIVLKDIDDEEASLVLEYVLVGFPPEQPKDDDLGFFYFDDLALWTRNHVRVTSNTNQDGVIGISGTNIDSKQLEKIVFKALKTGETEVDLGLGGEKDNGAWEWGAWALVDLSCKRVYAFKILLKEGSLVSKKTKGCLAYVACPEYGDVANKTRPISYAAEKVQLPELEPLEVQTLATDDDLDDFVPEPPKVHKSLPTLPPGEATPGQFGVPSDLSQRLASIDDNLSRLATAVEQLVVVLQSKAV